jgi:gliding motility-associated-like protein
LDSTENRHSGMKRFLFALTILTLSFNIGLRAQTDTLFWFVAPEVSQGLGDRPPMLYFNTYASASTVTITLPAHSTIAPIVKNIAANSVDSLDLTLLIDSIENRPANTVNKQGILIQASQNISSYYMVKSSTNKEIFTLKGQKGIGFEFYTPFQEMWNKGVTLPVSYASIDVVATQNNTTVLITPKNNVTGHVQNASFSVLLNKGETYSAQNKSSAADSSLAGSIVSSNNPIAVTVLSGAVSNGGCLSTLGDQLTNSTYIGNSYVVNKGTGSSEGVFVLATQNNTAVTFNDGINNYSNTINWSETDSFRITQPFTYISSTKPIYVWHVSGYGCKQSAAQVPAIYCSGSYSVAFNRATNDSFAVNLYTRSGYQNSFLLNGASGVILGSSFGPVPGTVGVMSARIYFTPAQIAAGSHNVISNTGDIFGCGIHNGSSTAGAGYGYISEFTSYPFINVGPATATICSNSTLPLAGIVGGGNVQGTWTSNGFGTFTSGPNALTNIYKASPLDTLIKPVEIILTTVGPCRQMRDTIFLTVTPQPLVNAGADQVMCASNPSVTLSGNVSLGSSTGIWTSLGSGTFSPSNTLFTPVYTGGNADTTAGQVTLVLTSTNNGSCAAVTDTMKITITNAAGVDAGPPSVSVCANNNAVVLNGVLSGSASSAKWTSSGTGVFTPDNLQLNVTYNPSPNDITLGQVTLKLSTTNNGLCKVAYDSITVIFTTPPLVNAGNNADVCVNTPKVTLNGTVSGAITTGVWSGGAGTFSPNNSTLNATYNPTASEISNGLLLLTLTSDTATGCFSANDVMQINFRVKPFANFSAASASTCLGNASSFTDFSNPSTGSLTSWNWNFGDSATHATIASPSHSYSISANYTVTLIVSNTYNCFDTTKRTLSIYPIPKADFGIQRNCGGTGLNLTFHDSTTVASPDTISSWLWDFGGLGNSTQQNPTQAYPNAPTSILYNVIVIVMSNHNCKDTAHQSFNLTPLAKAGFYFTYSSGQNVSTTVSFVDTSKNAVNWNYSFGDSPTGTSILQDPIYLYNANGNYIVTQVVHDAYGCADTARHVVKINNVTNEITQLIPNAISPNGDGKNDIWHLDFIKTFYPNALVEIFNRWGEKVYSNVGYSTAWDGTFNGNPLPVATYYYIVTLNDAKYPDPFKGSVLLLR